MEGSDRYFYEQLEALAETEGLSGRRLIVSPCDPTDDGSNQAAADGAAGRLAVAALARERVRRRAGRSLKGVDLVNAHFALYAFPLLGLIPKNVPLVVNFQGPWADEIRAESSSWKRRLVARAARHD